MRRDIGMVFQQFNLFPHLTILENCTLAPIWAKKMPKNEANDIAMHCLAASGFAEKRSKYRVGFQRPATRTAIVVPLHVPEDHAVPRADVRTRPGNSQTVRQDDLPGKRA